MIRFNDKVCLVTGAGSGIGRATALAFAREGAKVIVADLNESSGVATVDKIHDLGGDAQFVQVDTSRESEVVNMVQATVRWYGGIHCAVNGAGIAGAPQPLNESYNNETWHRVLAVNLTGVMYCVQHEVSQMLKQGGGVIVNIASAAGLKGFPNYVAYSAAKHGVVGLTKTVALENAKTNIRVNAVCPAFVETPMVMEGMANKPEMVTYLSGIQPIGRMGKPDEIADAILWLCADQSTFVTGTALAIDGGFMA